MHCTAPGLPSPPPTAAWQRTAARAPLLQRCTPAHSRWHRQPANQAGSGRRVGPFPAAAAAACRRLVVPACARTNCPVRFAPPARRPRSLQTCWWRAARCYSAQPPRPTAKPSSVSCLPAAAAAAPAAAAAAALESRPALLRLPLSSCAYRRLTYAVQPCDAAGGTKTGAAAQPCRACACGLH